MEVTTIKRELKYFEVHKDMYETRLNELNTKYANGEIDRDCFLIECNRIVTAYQYQMEDILNHIKREFE